MSILYAPQIDDVIGNLKSDPDLMNQKIHLGLMGIYASFISIKPFGDDDIRQIWIEAERGPVEVFGDYEEYKESGEVNNLDEFVELWQAYYPQKTKWYKFQTAKFRNELFFYFGDKLIFTINNQEQSRNEGKSGWNLEFLENFVQWLAEKVVEETNKLKNNPTAYNHYIRQNLPLAKQYGRIKRQYFWNILGNETIRPDIGLGEGLINKLKALLAEMKEIEKPLLQEMTANVFFWICEICYDANNYFKNQKEDLSSVEKYLSLADGRDAGLRNIEADSPQAFYNWYHSGDRHGGHPWEICRGGNSTHISLFVLENAGKWAVRLAGSSIVRVEETVRMAIALYENKIPFELSDSAQIVDMISGNDFIGIVPENIVPRYCQHLFPQKDRIIDFMNLNFEKECESKIIEKIQWYPLDKIELG
jgi:hypothetical protein